MGCIYANGVKLEEYTGELRSSMYIFELFIKGPVIIEARGVDPPVGNYAIEGEILLYTNNRILYIENAPAGASARIYNPTGQLITQRTLNDSRTAIPLSPGVYIVTVGNKTYKIMMSGE